MKGWVTPVFIIDCACEKGNMISISVCVCIYIYYGCGCWIGIGMEWYVWVGRGLVVMTSLASTVTLKDKEIIRYLNSCHI